MEKRGYAADALGHPASDDASQILPAQAGEGEAEDDVFPGKMQKQDHQSGIVDNM